MIARPVHMPGASKLAAIACVAAVVFASSSFVFAFQENTTSFTHTLTRGEPVTDKVNGGETKEFTVPLTAGNFVQFRVEQHGASLQATLIDPSGAQVIQMDSPSNGYGPILFSTITTQSGNYRVELKSVNAWALTYPFEIAIDDLRSPATQDESRVAAEKSFAEGRKKWNANEPAAAIQNYEAAKKFWTTTEDFHWQAVVEYALSEAYRNSNREQSEICLKETLRILNLEMAPSDWRLKASALNDLGALYATLATPQTEQATELLNQALALYASHNDRRGQASVLNSLANIQYRARNLSPARELATQALTFRRAENDKPGASNMISALGVIADGLGEPDEALTYLKESLQNWEAVGELKSSDKRRVASVLTALATESDKLGKWDDAFAYYNRALATFNEDDPFRAVALDNKGELYAALGNLTKARECYDQALQIWTTARKPDADLKAALLVHIGQLSITSNEIDSAIKTFEEALNLEPPATRRAAILTNLATAMSLVPNLAKALQMYNSTLELQKKLDDRRGQALTFQKRGEAYFALRRGDEALNDFRSALPLWRAVKDQRGEAAALNSIARVEWARGDLLSALANNAEAIRIVESLRTNISSYQLRTTYFAAQENYYDLDVDLKMQLNKVEKRNDYLAAALESSEKARARVLLDSLNEAGVDRSLTPQSADPRFSSLIEQKLKLLSALANKAQVRTKFLNGPHSPAQIANLDRELSDLNGKYDDLETQIRSQNPHFATLTKSTPAKLAEIQKQLDDDTLIVEFLLAEPRSYAWVVGNNSIEGVELPTQQDIESLAKRVSISLSERGRTEKNESDLHREQRIKRAESDYREASSLFSKNVLTPLVPLLTKKRLVIVADGALQLLPFGALPFPNQLNNAGTRSPQMLIEQHEIVSLPSASVLVLQRHELSDRKPAPYALAVIADPVFGEDDPRVTAARRSKDQKPNGTPKTNPGGTDDRSRGNETGRLTRALGDVGIDSVFEIRRLPFSFREAKEILKTVPVSQSFSALDFNANRATVMSPKLAQYRIVHLATHGVMDLKHPELSGILLSMIDENGKEQNGYLGLNEIYDLKWPAELVVLSACETGIGKEIKGEGLIALTRGFMYAGAARVVASLWKVNDRATAELMAEFYREMLVNGTTPAAALRLAQLKLSKHPRWQNPHFWAGFVLQGEWR
jgi:CHAT domain-containing protein